MDEQDIEYKPRTSTVHKTFIKMGDYLDEPELNSILSFPNFEIQKNKLLGSGDLSKVYLCTNIIDSKQYAVKIVSKDKMKSREIDNEIINSEIRIHERIIHNSIVRLYSHYEDKDSYYLFLEYIKGTTLASKISKGLNEKEACKYFSQIVNAINFCHSHRILYRDIKLNNVLVDNDGNVKLCDFGWSVEITKQQPKRRTTCGTYKYMAPEMINEKPYDFSIDIWALGILLYELLHGYSPYNSKDDNYTEIFLKVLKFKLNIQKEVSRNCRDLLEKLLTVEIKERFTIKEVVNHSWFNDWLAPVKTSHEEGFKPEETQDKMFYDIINVVQKKNEGKKGKKGKKNKSIATYKKNKGGNDKNDNSQLESMKCDSARGNNTSIPLHFNVKDIIENDQSSLPPIEDIDFKEKEPIEKVHERKLDSNDNLISLVDTMNNIDRKEFREEENEDEDIVSRQKLKQSKKDERAYLGNSNKEQNDPFKMNKQNTFNQRQPDPRGQSNRNHVGDYHLRHIPQSIQLNNKENDLENYYGNDLQATLDIFSKAEKLKNDGKKEIVKQEPTFWDKFLSPFKCGQAQPQDI